MTDRSISKNMLLYGVLYCFTPITAIAGVPMILISLVRLLTKERFTGPRIFEDHIVSSIALNPTNQSIG